MPEKWMAGKFSFSGANCAISVPLKFSLQKRDATIFRWIYFFENIWK